MKVCPNCQRENKDSSMYCAYCGYDLSKHSRNTEKKIVESTNTAANKNEKSVQEQSSETQVKQADGVSDNLQKASLVDDQTEVRHSKRAKRPLRLRWGLALGVVIVVLAVGGVLYQKKFGKRQQITAITQLITANNTTALSDSLVSNDAKIQMTDKTFKPFMTYANKHPEYVTAMRADLNRNGYTSDHTFTVVTASHKWFVVPVYKLRVTMMYPKIKTNVNYADIKVNGTTVRTTESDHETYTAGPLFPGSYQIKLTNGLTTLKTKVNLIGRADRHKSVSLLESTTDNWFTDSGFGESSTSSDSSQSSDSQTHTGSDYDDLSSSAQTAVTAIENHDQLNPDDYTFTESQPYTDVYEIKLYDRSSDKHVNTYRYDDVNNILAIYDSSTDKFVAED